MTSTTGSPFFRRTIAVLFPAILAQAAGNVLLSMRMKEIGNSHWLALLARVIESPTLWFGTLFLIISFLLFASALSWADLSLVVPAVSMEVVVNVLSANTLLHEVVSFARWTGVLFISIGVVLVLRSGGQKIQQEKEEILRRGR